MKDIKDIVPGNSYACRFKNEQGDTCLGVITVRDQENQLVRVRDTESDQEYVTSWNDVWDIDTVEWVEGNSHE